MKLLLACLVIGLQALWLVGSALVQEYHLANDPVVRLDTRTTDSRSVRRRDHITIRYDIGEVPLALFQPKPETDLRGGDTAFVVLERAGECYQPVRASVQRPELQPGQMVIRGRVDYTLRQRDPQTKRTADPVVRVRYGIERFYVSEGTGDPQGRLTVDAVVSSDGRPMLKQVYLDGRPYREALKQ